MLDVTCGSSKYSTYNEKELKNYILIEIKQDSDMRIGKEVDNDKEERAGQEKEVRKVAYSNIYML